MRRQGFQCSRMSYCHLGTVNLSDQAENPKLMAYPVAPQAAGTNQREPHEHANHPNHHRANKR